MLAQESRSADVLENWGSHQAVRDPKKHSVLKGGRDSLGGRGSIMWPLLRQITCQLQENEGCENPGVYSGGPLWKKPAEPLEDLGCFGSQPVVSQDTCWTLGLCDT